MNIKVIRRGPDDNRQYFVSWRPTGGNPHVANLKHYAVFILLVGLHSMEYLGATQSENQEAAHRYIDDADYEYNQGAANYTEMVEHIS